MTRLSPLSSQAEIADRGTPERIRIGATEIAARYGFTARHWVRQAALGLIPGATQPSGPRGHWLFERSQFESWWQSRRREVVAWPGFTVGEKPIGRAPSVRVENTAAAYRQQTEQLLNSVLGNGSPNSKRRDGAAGRTALGRKRKQNSFMNT